MRHSQFTSPPFLSGRARQRVSRYGAALGALLMGGAAMAQSFPADLGPSDEETSPFAWIMDAAGDLAAQLSGDGRAGSDSTQSQAAPRIYYVDWDRGNNAADGLAPDRPWKHAPGDVAATGRPLSVRLVPGDIVRFRGGVRYRGSIRVRATGTADRPIIYDGSSWGATRAIIDGSNALPTPIKCLSQAACLGAPNWRRLSRVSVPATTRWNDWIFANDEPMTLAQYPAVAEVMQLDDLERFATIPSAAAAQLRAGLVPATGLPADIDRGDPALALWNAGNELEWKLDPRFTPQGIAFDAAGFVPPNARDGRYAVVNSPAMVDAPGKYAVSGADGYAVLWPIGSGASYSMGARRTGFFLLPSQHLVIRGFSFTNSSNINGTTGVGNGIFGNNPTSNITLTQNMMQSMVLTNGDGAIQLSNSTNSRVTSNTIRNVPFGSGIRSATSPGPLEVSCNIIRTIGRTGIGLFGVREARVRGNSISDVLGLHGNAITVYLDSRLIEVSDNVVTNALRPLTLSGAGGTQRWDGPAARITVTRNTLVGTDPDEGAIASWGNGLTGVSITGNLLAAPKNAVRFMGTETNIVLDGNQLIGPPLVHNRANILTGSNAVFDPDGNGAALTRAAMGRTVPASVCAG